MKRFIIKSATFLTILFIIDYCIGTAIGEIAKKSKGGNTYAERYAADIATEPIIILGSSRANHHYIPLHFKDSFNLDCYNAGIDGNGILLMYGKFKMLSKRYNPRIIIYDISDFDIKNDDNTKYLGRLKFYYEYDGIKNIFKDVHRKEVVKMNASRLYRYNSQIVSIITNSTVSKKYCEDGYMPLVGTMDYTPEPFKADVFENDTLKLRYIESLIKDCKGKSELFFAISPNYFKRDIAKYKPIIELCNKYDIPVLNHYNDSNFIEKKELFKDRTHLNHKGAEIYTRVIVQEIRDLLSVKRTD